MSDIRTKEGRAQLRGFVGFVDSDSGILPMLDYIDELEEVERASAEQRQALDAKCAELERSLSEVTSERDSARVAWEAAYAFGNEQRDYAESAAALLRRAYDHAAVGVNTPGSEELARDIRVFLEIRNTDQRQGADSPTGATIDPSADQDHAPARHNAQSTVGALQEATETPSVQSAPATTFPAIGPSREAFDAWLKASIREHYPPITIAAMWRAWEGGYRQNESSLGQVGGWAVPGPWLRADEAKPAIDRWVLAWLAHNNEARLAKLTTEGWWTDLGYVHAVSHWMALPGAPEYSQFSIPEGWKLVPLEPTDEMVANIRRRQLASRAALGSEPSMDDKWVYRAMLAASPTFPAQGPLPTDGAEA